MRTYVVRMTCDIAVRADHAEQAAAVAKRAVKVIGAGRRAGPRRPPEPETTGEVTAVTDLAIHEVVIGRPSFGTSRGRRMTNSED